MWSESPGPPRWLGALTLALGLACSAKAEEPTGGETHFLSLCEPLGNCGGEYECTCNACTLQCEDDAECGPFARCTETVTGCGQGRVCERACAGDNDCAALSSAHTCRAGVCRAESTSGKTSDIAAPSGLTATEPDEQAPSDSGSVESDAAADSGEPTTTDATDTLDVEGCSQLPIDETLMLGDSFFALGGRVGAAFAEVARSAGVLRMGEPFRDASRLLDNGLAFMGNGLLEQYNTAVREAPVQLAILSGGGADALLGSCEDPKTCSLVTEAAAAADDLLSEMAAGGVTHAVFVFYPEAQNAPETSERLEALRPLMEEHCLRSALSCHWLDLRPLFAGQYETYILSDGMNPTELGAEVTANAIWATLDTACVELVPGSEL